MDEPFSIIAEACLNGDSGREIHWPAKTWSILNLLIFQVRILPVKRWETIPLLSKINAITFKADNFVTKHIYTPGPFRKVY